MQSELIQTAKSINQSQQNKDLSKTNESRKSFVFLGSRGMLSALKNRNNKPFHRSVHSGGGKVGERDRDDRHVESIIDMGNRFEWVSYRRQGPLSTKRRKVP